MSPAGTNKPEMACICRHRAPVTSPPQGRQTCTECGDEMYLVGSAHDFTKQAKKGVN